MDRWDKMVWSDDGVPQIPMVYWWPRLLMSMGWLKGKSTGNHRFSHEIWECPVIFLLNQSIDDDPGHFWVWPMAMGKPPWPPGRSCVAFGKVYLETARSVVPLSPVTEYDFSIDTLWLFNIAIETHHFLWGNPLFQWWFSIVMVVYQRVLLLTGFCQRKTLPPGRWGDQITNELARQLIEMSGFYFLDKDKRLETQFP